MVKEQGSYIGEEGKIIAFCLVLYSTPKRQVPLEKCVVEILRYKSEFCLHLCY